MTFGESIRHVFANLTNFKGRARRAEFWWFYLFISLVSIPVSILMVIWMLAAMAPIFASADPVTGELSEAAVSASLASIFGMYAVAFLVGGVFFFLQLAVWVRRLHDTGQSGHWLWLNLLSLGIVPLIMAIMEGQPHDNQYGPDPKAAERATNDAWMRQAYQQQAYPAPPAPPAPPSDPTAPPPLQ